MRLVDRFVEAFVVSCSIALIVLVIANLLGGCGDNAPPDVELIELDASIDAPADACVREPSDGCCALLPDEDAARACAATGLDHGCGVLVCWHTDCSLTQLPFCTP